ncbi:phosphonate ABC transporter, permease protein PhnE [Nocardiopsis metallicus]|uniref:Phosphonate transport system permease protein n=1 Tax=Nocardiopsis metallicus TaxID=179819 RepID=A0A840WR02_9ACTN|nr:phosphonate ABC transporter, permease protein PhnE [Nocardiopsis metallicus]MBB5492558.1 phosphonate transport system permease protein [Nocardiopsis metallicus]
MMTEPADAPPTATSPAPAEPPPPAGTAAPGSPCAAAERPRTLPLPRPSGVAALLTVLALVGVGVWSIIDLRINVATLVSSVDNAADFLSRTLPLDFPGLGELAGPLATTLAIVIAATLLSVALSIPLAIWAAGNTTPGRPARLISRSLIVVARAIPDVVLAILFFRLFGFGAVTGVLAMGLHSVGMVGKLYADAVEQIDEGPRQALRAAGAGRLQELTGGVLPQVLPAFVATAMHRLDINLRISVILGFVGVAGIGQDLAHALGRLDYQRGMALALIVLLLCVGIELLSVAVRRALLPHTEQRVSGISGLVARTRARAGAHSSTGSGVKAAAARRTSVDPRAASAAALATGRISPPWTAERIRRTCYVLVTLAVLGGSVGYAVLDFNGFIDSSRGPLGVLAMFWPPEAGGIGERLVAGLIVTVQIAFAATLLGMVLALPVGVLAARNVAPHHRVGQLCRMFIVFVRSIPELILAIIFVVMIGLGPVAGTLALAIGVVGLLGKLVADSVEEVDPGPERALQATGASRVQVFFGATLPQALPSFVGHSMYQLDVNIRSATILGIVGAGGIGYELLNAARVLEFGVVTLITLMVFGVVMVVELIAVWLRGVVGGRDD